MLTAKIVNQQKNFLNPGRKKLGFSGCDIVTVILFQLLNLLLDFKIQSSYGKENSVYTGISRLTLVVTFCLSIFCEQTTIKSQDWRV